MWNFVQTQIFVLLQQLARRLIAIASLWKTVLFWVILCQGNGHHPQLGTSIPQKTRNTKIGTLIWRDFSAKPMADAHLFTSLSTILFIIFILFISFTILYISLGESKKPWFATVFWGSRQTDYSHMIDKFLPLGWQIPPISRTNSSDIVDRIFHDNGQIPPIKIERRTNSSQLDIF